MHYRKTVILTITIILCVFFQGAVFGSSGGGPAKLVFDIDDSVGFSSSPDDKVSVNGVLFFSATTSANGRELYKSYGTAGGTRVLRDINSSGDGIETSSNVPVLAVMGDFVYFPANHVAVGGGGDGVELFRSDGTASGTDIVKNINAGGDGLDGDNTDFAVLNNELYFSANDGSSGWELWKSDGTATGTVQVKDIYNNGSWSSNPANLTVMGGTLYFSANDGTAGIELWKSDGTAGGTTLVKTINTDGDSSPSNLTVMGGMLYFVANDGGGIDLWKSDGTEPGTVKVKDINPGFMSDLTVSGGKLFFVCDGGITGEELWVSDGTEIGTYLVEDINANGSSYPSDLTDMNGILYFSADDDSNGEELWRSDGTESGTYIVKDICPTCGGGPQNMVNADGTLYFSAQDDIFDGHELWKSDGTESGTVQVQDINSSGSSWPKDFLYADGILYFTATRSTNEGAELWKLDIDPAAPAAPFADQATVRDSGTNASQCAIIADINGDGSMDVVAANPGDDSITWYSGPSPWSTEGTISNPDFTSGVNDVVALDVDSDGRLDLVSANVDATFSGIFMHRNLDNGTTWNSSEIIDPGSCYVVRVADFDNDGVVEYVYSTATQVFYRDPQVPPADYTGAASDLAVADINRDGTLDFVIADKTNDKLVFAYYNGLGLTDRQIATLASEPTSVFTGDINRDGDVDICAAFGNNITWYANINSGSNFSAVTVTTSAGQPQKVRGADVDSDGDLDIVAALAEDNGVFWYENTDGDGTFGLPQLLTSDATNAACVAAGDLDGDGDIDVVSASPDDDKVAWYENKTIHGSALFETQSPEVTNNASGVNAVYAADIDGDGDQDILSSSEGDDKIAWYENTDGAGSFGSQQVISTSADRARSVYAADIDGDGDLDVLSASYSDDKIAWYANTNGAGTFGSEQVISTSADVAWCVHAADLDKDGDVDVISASTGDNKIAWYENTNGLGTFGAQQVISTSATNARSVYAADIDQDGDMDIVSASSGDDKIAWYENTDGAGSFGSQQVISTTADSAYSVVAADIDKDGDMDVISASTGDDKIAWYENTDGAGTFGAPQNISLTADSAYAVYAADADADADGDVDVFSASSLDGKVAWYENQGGSWVSDNITMSGAAPMTIYAADLDGDGDIDVVSGYYNTGEIVWYENRGGQFALATENVTPQMITNGETAEFLKITTTHEGRAGDSALALTSFELYFDSGDDTMPLTSAEANALIENLYIYYDNDTDGLFDGTERLVTTVDTLALTGGSTAVELPFSASVQIGGPGSNMVYFVVAELTSNAGNQTPSNLRITHVTEASSTAEDGNYGNPLQLEYALNTPSGTAYPPSTTTTSTPATTTVGGSSPGGPSGSTPPGDATTTTTAPEPPPPGDGDPGGDGGPGTAGLGADFTALPVAGTVPLAVSFVDISDGAITSYAWDFGDGTTSSEANPDHAYVESGTFTVTLTVTGESATDTLTIEDFITVDPSPLAAGFTADVVKGNAPLAVQFSDTSTGAPISWSWNFGDGGSDTARNPAHAYTVPGTYTVSLVASDAEGSDAIGKYGYIVVTEDAPEADFSARPTTVDQDEEVRFTDASTGDITSRLWNFGDGQTSAEQNPRHGYALPGTYAVCLTATGPEGSSRKVREDYIIVQPKPGTYTVSGTITGEVTAGMEVYISGTLNRAVPVASDGTYIIEGLVPGTYTVTPLKPGMGFVPSAVGVTITNEDVSDIDFNVEIVGGFITRAVADPRVLIAEQDNAVTFIARVIHKEGLINIDTIALDLSPLDGPASVVMHDDGTTGDEVAGDGVFTWFGTVVPLPTPGAVLVPCTAVSDGGLYSYTATVQVEVVDTIDDELGAGDTQEYGITNSIGGQDLVIAIGSGPSGSARMTAAAEEGLVLQIFKPDGTPLFDDLFPMSGSINGITVRDAEAGSWSYQVTNQSGTAMSFSMKSSGAGTGTVMGAVIDAQDGSGIDHATISTNVGGSTVTQNGYYALLQPAGSFLIQAIEPEYVTASCSITLAAGTSVEANMAMLDKASAPAPDESCFLSDIFGFGDTAKLQLLRRFRDTVLAETPVGKQYISLYYTHSPEISGMLLTNSALRAELWHGAVELLPLAVKAARGERVVLSGGAVDALQGCLEAIRKQAGPKLAGDIDALLLKLDTGMTMGELVR